MDHSAVKSSHHGMRSTIRGSEMRSSHHPHDNPKRGSFKINLKKQVTFDPQDYMVAECSQKDIEIWKQAFDFLDEDHDGMLTPMDLRKAFRDYGGYTPPKNFVYVSMSNYDADDGGEITFKEFVRIMVEKPCENDSIEDFSNVFETLDWNSKGYISSEDLRRSAEELKEDLSDAQIDQMIRNCDPDGEGIIRRQAFIDYNKKQRW